jgi:hypothetical protein
MEKLTHANAVLVAHPYDNETDHVLDKVLRKAFGLVGLAPQE